ncbi:hypothetical protein ACFWFU_05250 [Streptomyces sp. NPDC060235]|uniref:hypothetical protein n=1 Tax=Streptomyces sp. NPDC060235 TaxID=3347080 RepID=UPI003657E9AF
MNWAPPTAARQRPGWFSTLDDALERQPFNQIVSYAVETFQNIGRFCVWMDTDPLTDEKVRERLSTMFENQLDSLPAETLARLTPLIPAEWMSDYAQEDDVRVECWDEAYAKVKSAMAWHATEAQAWAAEKDPLDAGQLAMLKAIGDQCVAHEVVKAEREFRQMMRQPRPGDSEPLADSVELSDEQYAFLDSINADKARVDRIWKRQKSLVEEQEKPRGQDAGRSVAAPGPGGAAGGVAQSVRPVHLRHAALVDPHRRQNPAREDRCWTAYLPGGVGEGGRHSAEGNLRGAYQDARHRQHPQQSQHLPVGVRRYAHLRRRRHVHPF